MSLFRMCMNMLHASTYKYGCMILYIHIIVEGTSLDAGLGSGWAEPDVKPSSSELGRDTTSRTMLSRARAQASKQGRQPANQPAYTQPASQIASMQASQR